MRRKALLLTTRPDTSEMEELIFALGADLAGTTHQRRLQPDPQWFLGSGKLEEARATQRALGAGLVVVNAHLKPGQIFNIQKFFNEGGPGGIEVYDRTRLILEIFRERARSPEARLQVELAQLTYEMPLVKEAINLLKKGERPGFLAGGSYEVEQYHDMMKKRMARIRRDLEKMRRERGVRRKHRRRGGFHLVSLAGYTNAGKSSLLRALSAKDTLVENRYFSTLSTKTARARSDRREILLTDTVGFIEDLPPWMVEAFHSTLEEIALADVILLVLDASDPVQEMARRLRSSLRILWEFDGRGGEMGDLANAGAWAAAPGLVDAGGVEAARKGADGAASGPDAAGAAPRAASGGRILVPMRRGLAPILVALNKVDRVDPDELEEKVHALQAEGLLPPDMLVRVSAREKLGLEDLYEKLYTLIPDYDEYEMALPSSPEAESLVAWLHEHTDVLDMTRGNEVHLHFEAKRSLRQTILDRMASVGATPLREVQRQPPEPEVVVDDLLVPGVGEAEPEVPPLDDAHEPDGASSSAQDDASAPEDAGAEEADQDAGDAQPSPGRSHAVTR